MRLFRRLFGRNTASARPAATPSAPDRIPGVRGRIPASRAVAMGGPVALGVDPGARLVAIVSDTNIDGQGLAHGWQLSYDLPSRGSQLTVSLAPCPDAEPSDDSALCLDMKERPFVPHLEPAFSAGVARSLKMTVEEFEAARRQQALTGRPGPLPVPFRDSPDAALSLIEQGADFTSGPTDMALSTERLKDGTVVWKTGDRRRDYTTPFGL